MGHCSTIAGRARLCGPPDVSGLPRPLALGQGLRTPTDAGYIAILGKAEDLFVEGRTEDSIIYMM